MCSKESCLELLSCSGNIISRNFVEFFQKFISGTCISTYKWIALQTNTLQTNRVAEITPITWSQKNFYLINQSMILVNYLWKYNTLTCATHCSAVLGPAPHTPENLFSSSTFGSIWSRRRKWPVSMISQIFLAKRSPTKGRLHTSWKIIVSKQNLF